MVEFGLEECGMLILPDGLVMKEIDEDKYLGILKVNGMREEEILKSTTKTEISYEVMTKQRK